MASDGLDGALAHVLAHRVWEAGAWRLFHQLLMAALHGAVALAQIDAVAVVVAEHLHLDMLGVAQILLDIEAVVVERLAHLALRRGEDVGEFLGAAHQPDAASTTTRRRLQHQRGSQCAAAASSPSPSERMISVPGSMGSPPLRHRLARLAPYRPSDHRGGWRADEDDAAVGADLGEAGILGEEAVAWVNRVAVGEQRRADDVGNVEVALAAGGGPMQMLLVGHANRQRVASASE